VSRLGSRICGAGTARIGDCHRRARRPALRLQTGAPDLYTGAGRAKHRPRDGRAANGSDDQSKCGVAAPRRSAGRLCRVNNVALEPTGRGPLDGLSFRPRMCSTLRHRTGLRPSRLGSDHPPATTTAVGRELLLGGRRRMVGKTLTESLPIASRREHAYGTPVNPAVRNVSPGGSRTLVVAGGGEASALGGTGRSRCGEVMAGMLLPPPSRSRTARIRCGQQGFHRCAVVHVLAREL